MSIDTGWKQKHVVVTKADGDYVTRSHYRPNKFFQLKYASRSWRYVRDLRTYVAIPYEELDALISELMDFRDYVIENIESEPLPTEPEEGYDPGEPGKESWWTE